MPTENNSSQLNQWLEEQLKIEGANALYTALDKNTGNNFEFNAFDDLWRKSSGNKATDVINLTNINNSLLTWDEQKDIRLTLAKTLSSGRFIDNQCYVIHTLKLESLAIAAMEKAFSTGSKSQKVALKQLINNLAVHFPHKYKHLRDAFESKKIKQNKSLAWDMRKGALSNYEMSEIQIEMNEWANTLFDLDVFNKWKGEFGSGSGKITHIGRLNQFIASRIVLIFSFRPEQINLIKWSDFSNSTESKEEPFLFDGEGLLTPYMIKQLDDEPTRPEADPRPVSVELSNELKKFLTFYIFYIKQAFSESKLNISEEEVADLLQELPLLINEDLIDEIKSSNTTTEAISIIKNNTWLIGRNKCRVLVDNFFKNLNSDSDRVPKSEYKVTSKRFRHYTGTTLSLANETPETIASALTQSSTDAAKKYYIHIPPDVQAQIDNTRIDSKFLVQAANGGFVKALRNRISTSVKENEVTIEQIECGELGKSASLPACQGCTKTKPLSCYGCINFKPLASGNHKHYLSIALNNYEDKRKAGFTGLHLAMYEHQIRKIEVTIHYCDAALKALSNKREAK